MPPSSRRNSATPSKNGSPTTGSAATARDEGLDHVFQRVSRRHPGFAPIHDAIEDLTTHREVFEKAFHQFFPDLRQWVRALGPEADAVF